MPNSHKPQSETAEPGYDVSKPCLVCGAIVGQCCFRYTGEFNDQEGARYGDPTPWPHRFGGRVTPPGSRSAEEPPT